MCLFPLTPAPRLLRLWVSVFGGRCTFHLLDQLRPSVRVAGISGALRKRQERPIVMGILGKSYPGYSGDPSRTPYDHPFPPNWGLAMATPVKTCIANCGQTVPNTRVVCIDSLWKLISSQPNSTIVDPYGYWSFPQNWSNQQNKLNRTAKP